MFAHMIRNGKAIFRAIGNCRPQYLEVAEYLLLPYDDCIPNIRDLFSPTLMRFSVK